MAETGNQSRWIYRRAWRWRRDRAIIAASLGGTGGRHRSLASAGEQGRGGGGGGGEVSGDHVRVDASSQHTNCTELHRARFTQNMLRQSYDSAKATIDLRRTSNLQNIVRSAPSFSWVRFTRKIVRRSETVFVLLACAIPKRSFSTFLSHCRK